MIRLPHDPKEKIKVMLALLKLRPGEKYTYTVDGRNYTVTPRRPFARENRLK